MMGVMYPTWLSRVLNYGVLPGVLAVLVWTALAHPSVLPGWVRAVSFGGAAGYGVSIAGDLVRLMIKRSRRADQVGP